MGADRDDDGWDLLGAGGGAVVGNTQLPENLDQNGECMLGSRLVFLLEFKFNLNKMELFGIFRNILELFGIF